MLLLSCIVIVLCGVTGPNPADIRPARGWPAVRERGTVLVLHGGGWAHPYPSDAGIRSMEDHSARRYRAWGFHTVNMTYRPGRAGYADVARAVRAVRLRTGRAPCVAGASAGAHLALLVGARERTRCVIAEGSPTDLAAPELPAWTRGFAVRAFGSGGLGPWSPVRNRPRAPILLAHSRTDLIVPVRQAERMHIRYGGRLVLLRGRPGGRARPGCTPWVHSCALAGDLRAYYEAQRRFLTIPGSAPRGPAIR